MIDIDHYAGDNTNCVSVGNLRIYFSYTTAIAFYTPKDGYVISENVWSNTTGNHLNKIRTRRPVTRVPYDEFKKRLAEVNAAIFKLFKTEEERDD